MNHWTLSSRPSLPHVFVRAAFAVKYQPIHAVKVDFVPRDVLAALKSYSEIEVSNVRTVSDVHCAAVVQNFVAEQIFAVSLVFEGDALNSNDCVVRLVANFDVFGVCRESRRLSCRDD